MAIDDAILKIISNETIDSIHNLGIVTPSIYKSVFSKHALEHGTDIDDEEKLTDSILDEKIQMCNAYQEKTSQSAIDLSNNTSKAISAIQSKDEDSLKEVLRETNNLKKEIEKLKEAVYKDELTHAFNRKWLNDKFLNNDADTFKEDGTLAIIDLNYFKIVNDTYGHIIGDKVLIYIANQLKKSKESVIRYGGDEFIVIFRHTDKDTAFAKLNEIRESIISKKLKAGEKSFKVSFSIGAYEFKAGNILSNVIEFADKNMYNDKTKIKKRITGID